MTENETKQESNTIKEVDGVEGQVFMRKFDSEDVMKLRDEGLNTVIDENGNESIHMNLGSMTKWNIILGVKSASFFSKSITEERGAQPVINSRVKEFRSIPLQAIDTLFNAIRDYNAVQYDDEYAKK